MTSGDSAYGDLDSEDDFIEDYEETPAVSKKNWFKPASVSLARLDKVKPVATVYNLGLRDPRDLQAGRGKAASVLIPAAPVPPVSSQVPELQAEPPLSTLSYQKAAWGSQTSIPELLKQAAQAGIRPSRPSSAKTGVISKPPQSRKLRPQSAKDPLCPPGKKKTSTTFGVKGHKFDPSERGVGGRPGVPLSGSSLGWAGPPAGLYDPSTPHDVSNAVSPELYRTRAPPPPAPNASPEPEEEDGDGDSQPCSPPPSPVCLSLSLPSADVDVDEEMDTARLMEEADKYVKVKKKKDSQKIKYFRADLHSPKKTGGGGGVPPSSSRSSQQQQLQRSPHADKKPEDYDRTDTCAGNDLKAETKSLDSGFEDAAAAMVDISPKMHVSSSKDKTGNNNVTTDGSHPTLSKLSLELETDSEDGAEAEADSEKPLPPDNGYDLQYLGPARKDKKNRSHPIFLMPEKRSVPHNEPSRPSSGRARNEKQQNVIGEAKGQSQQKSSAQLRSGVHIREDCNVTVDITPRNIGRKVTKMGASRKQRADSDSSELDKRTDAPGKPQTTHPGGGRVVGEEAMPQLEIMGNSNKDRTANPGRGFFPNSAAKVSVMYDDNDDDDGDGGDGKKKKLQRRRRRPLKEKDLVTMVSNLKMSDDGDDDGDGDDDDDEDGDDPSQEVDISMGSSELGRSASQLSTGERNYYDVARKQTKDNATASANSGAKVNEDFITVTTKTILFDLEKPKESVVKTILDAPLSKQQPKERSECASPGKLIPARPRSAARPKSAKLSKSDFHNVKPLINSPPLPKDYNSDDDNSDVNFNDDGGFTTAASTKISKSASTPLAEEEEEERPESRMGFVSMETDVRSDGEELSHGSGDNNNKQMNGIGPRPPSGKRRPLSASRKTLHRPSTANSGRLQRQTTKEGAHQNTRRPQSASSTVSQAPSAADVQRANAAAQALRCEREAAAKPPLSAAASRLSQAQSQRHYASYSRQSGSRRAKSATVYRKPVQIVSNDPNAEVEVTEEMQECRDIHNRLACYGIDVKPETLERALYPPSGRTLYYQLDAGLPTSNTHGLLSHPRYWLPEEHRKLKIAEKKLAMAELSLWRQKKEEERKAKIAAGKEKSGKKGKKKGKKKLRRSQSIC